MLGFAAVTVLGWLGENGHDRGLFKEVWEQVKIVSPGLSVLSLAWSLTIWREWMRDRDDHGARTDRFTKLINMIIRKFERAEAKYLAIIDQRDSEIAKLRRELS